VTTYLAPLEDIRFALRVSAGLEGIARLQGFEHAEPDLIDAVLDEAGKFAANVVAPSNRPGDKEGSRWENGVVRTPDNFKQVYRQFCDAGWNGVPFPADFGGGDLPWAVSSAIQEMNASANLAFSLCPMLTQGTIEAIEAHGTAEQKTRYLEKLISGKWTGTMNLTEPQAGSDVGALKTRAKPAGDGLWKITGTKIFITYGDHDMAENIVHLVLARTPGSPPGTKGISLFLVPKYKIKTDGSLGEANDVRCVSLEHKLGIHGSPTCVLSFGDGGGAIGELLGGENAGMRCMFTVMNAARLGVGVQGLAISERAYQQALAFAMERKQGRGPGAGATESSTIIHHPDVRRMLMLMRSQIEAMRALIYYNASAIDFGRRDADPEARARFQARADLLIPVSKGWCTELSCILTALGVQVHGGMGFIEETGAAQHLRDAKITTIYEGTTGIQAIDLVGRKLAMQGGDVVRSLIAEIKSLDATLAAAGPAFAPIKSELAAAIAALDAATTAMLSAMKSAPAEGLGGATAYLYLFGTVVGGWLLAKQALAAQQAGASPEFATAKLATASFYATQVLPQAGAYRTAAIEGAKVLAEMPEALFRR
jgi:alkylation response protein AidB-like acyl-CoA dehydrogenase